MLSQIVDGREKSNFVLITDSSECSGWELLFAITNNLSKKYDAVHMFLFEKLPEEVSSSVLPETKQKLRLHDFSTDPLGWINSEGSKDIQKFSFANVLRDSGGSVGNCAVVIDSISTLLRYCSLQNFCFRVNDLKLSFSEEKKPYTIVGLYHHDVCGSLVKTSVEYLADTVLNMVTESDILGAAARKRKTPSENRKKLCKLIHKKHTGKVVESVESFGVLRGTVIDIRPWNPETVYKNVDEPSAITSNEDDPTANLTFNLSLSSEEKSARSKLVMPYTKPRHVEVKMEEDSLRSGSGDGGLIYYEPDEADDFDEEDPDDDLDF